MNYSFLAVFIVTLSLSSFISLNIDNKISLESSIEQSQVGQFMNYVYAFDDYYKQNPSATGDITSKVALPSWLPKNANIKMVINNGVGYVYIPLSKGMMREILKWTDNSASVGISNGAYINTVSGKIAKPSFIGYGYIVYVR
ncbi:type IV pilus biogenesis protein PilM [Photorhabdus temperata]|uniref:Type IV pilus biogenesis protein PilM n=1 Tax=Photorhabdus temperata J3 TaxID=1389415 RepID=U7R889_PHOTE|nr:type IV pilus biogenesis protein PilM [Photorhabdus temperata]EQB98972.1 conjugal transfer protein [Photorhabdus temperata subsp. temperata M1021]ERT14901.1 hypothetical protein O185_01165 [Photorhabdus temperata J3]